MLKIALICAFIAFTSAATPSWLGKWYVLNVEGSSICNMPSNVTYALMSMYMGNVVLYADNVNGVPGRWDFDGWTDPNNQTQSSCFGTQCVDGFLVTGDGINYANITWSSTTGPQVWCSILLSPANVSWVGNWFVLNSGSNSLAQCDVPKKNGLVNLTNQTNSIQMSGVDLLDNIVTEWDLGWAPNQINARDVCNGNFCVNAQLNIVAGVLHGNITWNITGTTYYCRTEMYRLITGEEAEGDYDVDSFISDDDNSRFLDILAF